MNQPLLKVHLTAPNTWKRILFMFIFVIIVSVVRTLLWGIIGLQVLSILLTGNRNKNILVFSHNLCVYLYHITLFLTFDTEIIPFPFSDWQATHEMDSFSNKS